MVNCKICIVVPTGEYPRTHVFQDSFDQMLKPDGTIVAKAHGQSPAKNRNLGIAQALQADCTHVLFLDDDMEFPNHLLLQLLAHDKDVVTAFYVHRNYPHLPVLFDRSLPDQRAGYYQLTNDTKGLQPIVNCGLGAVLIKTFVLKQMPSPWITLGSIEKDQWCDDIDFFNRLRSITIDLWCDFSLTCGHVHPMIITPVYRDGQWTIEYNSNGSSKVAFPIPYVEHHLASA